jgi:predicted glycogen debranching enzyme
VHESEKLLGWEWLVANGLGGYASGTLAGAVTRRYHGLLIAALPAPLGRIVMLSYLTERAQVDDGTMVDLIGLESAGRKWSFPGSRFLREFRLEMGIPVWRYVIGESVLEKSIIMPHEKNTVHVTWHLVSSPRSVRLELRPAVHFRPQEAPVNENLAASYGLTVEENQYTLFAGEPFPPLRILIQGKNHSFTMDRKKMEDVFFRHEAERGYSSVGSHWSPGAFGVELAPKGTATFVASTENWDIVRSLSPQVVREAETSRRLHLLESADQAARQGIGAELVMAADQFVMTPAGRAADEARARAAGDEARSVVAGYHWFTDWGRDTMIGLEGLTLATGRQLEAGYILRTFATHIKDGLIPNVFPEHERTGLYHTADATLWFFHALSRYLQASQDGVTLRVLLPKLIDIIDLHLRGTRFGIHVDTSDGLLVQGEEGYQLTWMDAKVGDWIVTPRRGKAVEINALWYNALRLLETWVREERGQEEAAVYAAHAERAYESFNHRFWYDEGGYLYDVVDQPTGGNDPACRPNQLIAISLDWPVLEESRWAPVLKRVQDELLTPVGLRSLSPRSPDYKAQYFGDLRTRDAAYHQGTVWAWLIGPFIDAWMRVHPGMMQEARAFLNGFESHMGEVCLGSIAEIFDATPPYAPRGCVAQAWSVAEVLRCWVKTGRKTPLMLDTPSF